MKSVFIAFTFILGCAAAHAEVRIVDLEGPSFIDRVNGGADSIILVGDTIRWNWIDGDHTTTSNTGLWDAVINMANPTFDFQFTSAGSFPYRCVLHDIFGMRGTVTVKNPIDVAPTRVDVTRGTFQSGSLSDLFFSDNNYLIVQQLLQFSPALPNVEIEVTCGPVPANVISLRAGFEAACTGVPSNRVIQRVQLWDVSGGRWVTVDERTPSTSDTYYEIVAPGTTGQQQVFIDPITRDVRVRIGYLDRGTLSPGWATRFDQVFVRVATL